jgi:hypothetical protein
MTDKSSLETFSSSLPDAFQGQIALSVSPLTVSSTEESSCTSVDSCIALLPAQVEAEFISVSQVEREVQEDDIHTREQELEEGRRSPSPVDKGTASASEPAQPMQEVASRRRIPTQRLKSSALFQSSRGQPEGGTDSPQRHAPKTKKVKSGLKEAPAYRHVEEIERGDLIEMFESMKKIWLRVRVMGVNENKLMLRRHVKQPKAAVDQETSSSWFDNKWIEFQQGLFRRFMGKSNVVKALSVNTKGGKEKKSTAAKAASPAARSEGGSKKTEKPAKDVENSTSKTKDNVSKAKLAAMKEALKIRKQKKDAKDQSKKVKSKTTDKESGHKKTSKPAVQAKRLSKGSQDGDSSSGSGSSSSVDGAAEPAAPIGNQRRDWGLMHVDAVGRNRPPFARTLLFHGPIQVCPRSFFCCFPNFLTRCCLLARWRPFISLP